MLASPLVQSQSNKQTQYFIFIRMEMIRTVRSVGIFFLCQLILRLLLDTRLGSLNNHPWSLHYLYSEEILRCPEPSPWPHPVTEAPWHLSDGLMCGWCYSLRAPGTSYLEQTDHWGLWFWRLHLVPSPSASLCSLLPFNEPFSTTHLPYHAHTYIQIYTNMHNEMTFTQRSPEIII